MTLFRVGIILMSLLLSIVISSAQSTIDPIQIYDMTVSPDGQYLAYSTGERTCNPDASDNFNIHILELATDTILQTIDTGFCPLNALSWSKDSTRIAWSASDGDAQVWDALNNEFISRPEGVGRGAISTTGILWHPERDYIAFNHVVIQISDAQTGQSIRGMVSEATQGSGLSGSFDWSADGNTLALTRASGTIEFWDTEDTNPENWMLTNIFENVGETIGRLNLHPDGTSLIVVNDFFNMNHYDSETLDLQASYDFDAPLTDIAWSADGTYIGAMTFEGDLSVWSADTTDLVYEATYDWLDTFAWHPDGDHLIVGIVEDNVIRFEQVIVLSCDTDDDCE